MRLIDADKLMSDIGKRFKDTPADRLAKNYFKEVVNEQPTAFDKAKVLDEFNNRIDPNVDTDTGEQCNNWVVDMQNEIVVELGKIVMAGGVESGTE